MRRALISIHRWAGLALLLYVLMICLSGSVLVYRNELYRHFAPQPVPVEPAGALLTDPQLKAAAQRAFPGYAATQIWRGKAPNHAVEVQFTRGDKTRTRLIDPYRGSDLGESLPAGYRFTAFLMKLHADLLQGPTGRLVNGAVALSFLLMATTGVLIWRPRGRHRPAPARLTARRLHMTVGIWVAAFVLMWGVTGAHLAFPQAVAAIVDYVEPFDETNPVERVGDQISYWLAYLHFGRIGGRVSWCGRGTCNDLFKAVWAVVALLPVLLAATGLWTWWRRVRPARLQAEARA
ncbi:MAG: hypothetical protein B7Y99_05870 [Caulobacterales bacterium 32-69-10]|nr:MAG: hypothetical protein B7Y99_05870 [Caulobacterales bacterium 32-69-10]